MPKRGRSSELTGGTGDVNPQYFNMTSQAAVTTAFASTVVPTPINKFPEGSGRVVIMEVLKVLFYATGSASAILTPFNRSLRMYVTTKNFAATEPLNPADGTIVAIGKRDWISSGTPANTNAVDWPLMVDLTDGAGHGMMVATDNLFLGIIQAGATLEPYTGTIVAKLIYRFKKVSLAEYIGIVQSQQNS